MRCMTGPVNPIGSVRFLSTKVSEEMTLARSFAIILVSMVQQKDWEIFGIFLFFSSVFDHRDVYSAIRRGGERSFTVSP